MLWDLASGGRGEDDVRRNNRNETNVVPSNVIKSFSIGDGPVFPFDFGRMTVRRGEQKDRFKAVRT